MFGRRKKAESPLGSLSSGAALDEGSRLGTSQPGEDSRLGTSPPGRTSRPDIIPPPPPPPRWEGAAAPASVPGATVAAWRGG